MKKKILALDIGDKRIGVAISDELGITAQPLYTISGSRDEKISRLFDLCLKEGIHTIVIGNPLDSDGNPSEQSKKVIKFIERFSKKLESKVETKGLKISYLDERFTTAQARKVVVDSKLKDADLSSAHDVVSATLILDTYLRINSKI